LDAPLGKGGPWPLLIYSHGTYGRPDNATHICEFLASRGYVVAAPAFPLTSSVSSTKLPAADVSDAGSQPGDVSFLIDSLIAHARFGPAIDAERIGTTGISLGGITTYFASFGLPTRDPRIKASAPIAPGDPVYAALGFGLGFGGTVPARVNVPALLLVRVFVQPRRWVLPPGACVAFSVTAAQSVLHQWWLPTDYGNRIYKTAIGIYLTFVVHLAGVVDGNGWILTPLLNRVLPVCVILGVLGLLWWGRRLERRAPGSLFRPLLGVVVVLWLGQLYSRGLPDEFPVVQSLQWYIPWPVWGAVIPGILALASVPGLEIALLLEAFFGIPGLGSITVDAIAANDFATLRTMVFIGSLLLIFGQIATDLSYGLVDPRVRFE
ncbi:MAG: ABC transporter permease subunit, partial [bacterium]